MKNKKIYFCITGSFCTFRQIIPIIRGLKESGNTVIPVLSFATAKTDTRFYKASDFIKDIEEASGNKAITSIFNAEPIGPQRDCDLLIIAPCTGNTLSKLCNAVTDTPVLMATKAHLRNNLPVLIALSSNDALSSNMQNLGSLMAKKNIFFVPFGQDDFRNKPFSLVADYTLIEASAESAINLKQIQPVLKQG